LSQPVSFGFLRPQRSRVEAGPWTVLVEGAAAVENPEIVRDWDYMTDLRVVRALEVDLDGLRADCGLSLQSRLEAVITWQSSWTGLRGAGQTTALRNGMNTLDVELTGPSLGGRLNLEARVVLAKPGGGGPLSPRRPGSTLWTDGTRIALEGSGMRFPVIPVPFDVAGLAGGRQGTWALTVEASDLSASGAGSVLLYLNSRHPIVQELLELPDLPRAQALQQFIHFDVARQLFVQALQHQDLDESQEYEEDSLGTLMLSLISRLFPDRELTTLRGDYRTSPGELEAEIQARLGFLVS
jgi:hypothetical protein